MSNNSPTCILSSSCLQGPPHAGHHHQQIVATISAEVESPPRDAVPTDRNRCLFLDRSRSPCSLPDIQSTSCSQNTTFLQPQDASGGRYSGSSQTPLQKSAKSSKISGWKTSKFFSKSMTSGEILRGLKKLSLTSSSSEDGESKSSSAPSLKSRLTNLKKRSSCGSDDVTIDVESLTTVIKGEQKASRPPSLGDATSSTKSSQDDGIVCKKEDLKAILSGASKRGSTPRRTQLRQTKSASFEPTKDDIKKGVRRTGSEESRPRKSMSVDSEEQQSATCKVSVESNEVFDDKDTRGKVAVVEVSPPGQKQTVAPASLSSTLISAEDNVSTVKWDESEVVDAVLIGDAIENFLKGSMSGSERRVSFRKT